MMKTIAAVMLVALSLPLGWALLGAQAQKRSQTVPRSETEPMKTAPRYSKSGYDLTPLSKEQIAEIVKTLTPEQIQVTQDAGTEPAFCGNLVDQKKPGIYVCVVGGLPMFRSTAKFDSGTGW